MDRYWWYPNTAVNEGSTLNNQHAIVWTNDDPVDRCIYVSIVEELFEITQTIDNFIDNQAIFAMIHFLDIRKTSFQLL